MERLKVFIPATAEAYKKGYGELCYFLVNEDVIAAYDREAKGGKYSGILDEQPLFYPELKPGQELPLKLQGIDNPIIPIEALKPWRSIAEIFKELADTPEE